MQQSLPPISGFSPRFHRRTAPLVLLLILLAATFSPQPPIVRGQQQGSPPATLAIWSPKYHSSTINDTNLLPTKTFVADLNITSSIPIAGFDLRVIFDFGVLRLNNIANMTGTIFGTSAFAQTSIDNPFSGVRIVGATVGSPWTGSNGVLLHLNFTILRVGVSPLGLYETLLAGIIPGQRSSVVESATKDGYFVNRVAPGPVASFSFSPANPVKGQSVTLNAQTSYDPDNATFAYFDRNRNSRWDPVETVVYDPDNDNLYQSSTLANPTPEPVLTGATPANNTMLQFDAKVMFVNATNSPAEAWSSGKAVVYDTDGNGKYDSGEPVIAGTAPAPGTPLKADMKIKYVDSDGNGIWDPVEPVVYDRDSDGLYQTSTSLDPTPEWVIAGTTLTNNTLLKFDPLIKFVNVTANPAETWSSGKAVVYDTDGNGKYDSGEPVIAGTAPAPGTPLKAVQIGPSKGIMVYDWFFGTNDGRHEIDASPVVKHVFGGEFVPRTGTFWVRLIVKDFEGFEGLRIERVVVTQPVVHDLGISNLSVNPEQVSPGRNASVEVRVENTGVFTERFNLTLKLGPELLTSWQNQALEPQGSVTFNYTITTDMRLPGVYQIAAEIVMPVRDATPDDNTRTAFLRITGLQASILPFILGSSGALIAVAIGLFAARRIRSKRAAPSDLA